jgi:hypothetical protein
MSHQKIFGWTKIPLSASNHTNRSSRSVHLCTVHPNPSVSAAVAWLSGVGVSCWRWTATQARRRRWPKTRGDGRRPRTCGGGRLPQDTRRRIAIGSRVMHVDHRQTSLAAPISDRFLWQHASQQYSELDGPARFAAPACCLFVHHIC